MKTQQHFTCYCFSQSSIEKQQIEAIKGKRSERGQAVENTAQAWPHTYAY